MNTVTYIREHVFGEKQKDMAHWLGRSQATVSRIEAKGYFPSNLQPVVRKRAKDLALKWDDSYFFEVPEKS